MPQINKHFYHVSPKIIVLRTYPILSNPKFLYFKYSLMMQAFPLPTALPQDSLDGQQILTQFYAMQHLLLLQTHSQLSQLLKIRSPPPRKLLPALQAMKTRKTVVPDYYPTSNVPILVKVMANIVMHALNNTDESQYLKDPLNISVTKEEWHAICNLIESRNVLFNTLGINCSQDLCIQILSQCLLFTPQISDTVFRKLHFQSLNQAEPSCQLNLKSFHEFLTLDHRNSEFLYKFLCEDDKTALTREFCRYALGKMFGKIAQYYHGGNLIEHMIDNRIESKVNFEKQAQQYLQYMALFQESDKKAIIEQLTEAIFGASESVECRIFLRNVEQITEPLKNLLFMMLDLMKLENVIINLVLEDRISETPQKNPLQYYGKLIEKIKNKCRGKEDEFCNCKRCQCIKRNRDSARESQKRKREALERLRPLQEECEKLEKRVKAAEDRNLQLKSILQDVFKHPQMSDLLSTTFRDRVPLMEAEIGEQKWPACPPADL